MWKDFKAFAIKGNVLDMAVGIIIGAAFGTIARSLVDDIIMPPIGMLLGNIDFSNIMILLKPGPEILPPYATVDAAKAAGAVTINIGLFINNIISFIIVAFSVFLLVKMVNSLKKKEVLPESPAPIKECPYCFTAINIKATRCPACTAELVK